AHERDPPPVRRPARQLDQKRGFGELHFVAAVNLAYPQVFPAVDILIAGDVGNALPISRKVCVYGRNVGEERLKLSSLGVVLLHLRMYRCPPQTEQPRTIRTYRRNIQVQRSEPQAGRLPRMT